MVSNPAPDSTARRRCLALRVLPAALLAFVASAYAGQQSVAWDASTTATVTGYFVHVGNASRTYGARYDAQNTTRYTVDNLTNGATYYFAVQAYDANGATSAISNEFRATVSTASGPTASFSATPTTGAAPLAVSFTSVSSGAITAYLWDFGDGATSTQANPRHTYTKLGTYSFKLTVVGPGGSSNATGTVTTTSCEWRNQRKCL